jgi:hypothetical protein
MSTRVIRYRTRPEHAAENRRLVEDVFAELATRRPGGVRYQTYVLDDGCSFVHVVDLDDDAPNPLLQLEAFARFQDGIGDRCEEQPVAATATAVGGYEPAR